MLHRSAEYNKKKKNAVGKYWQRNDKRKHKKRKKILKNKIKNKNDDPRIQSWKKFEIWML